MPFDTAFSRKKHSSSEEESVDIFDTTQFSNISMTIPYKINTIGIIDGQHRVFSHYEGADALEKDIDRLRNKRHLFVTGLFFDRQKFNESQKRKLEAEIFLQINNEQKKVNKALLQHIKSISDPYSAVGIAKRVMTKLNTVKPFVGMFSDSELVTGGIRTTSILQYGLQALVTADSNNDGLYKYWLSKGGEALHNEDSLEKYIEFCTNSLSVYFCAVKAKYSNEWRAKSSKGGILTSTTIVT